MKKTVKVKKCNSTLEIEVDVSRIVAISEIYRGIAREEPYETYYIYFENAVWSVQSDSYEEVRKVWLES